MYDSLAAVWYEAGAIVLLAGAAIIYGGLYISRHR
jgi:hypothetical protein